ncbi:MAG: hypothetical protein AAGI23_03605 [Bacteroidota bacterium]
MIYISCQLIIIALVIGLAGGIVFSLRRFLGKKATSFLYYLRLAIAFWLFSAALWVFQIDWLDIDIGAYNVLIISVLPIVFVVWLMRSRRFQRLLKLIPPAWLIQAQSFRLLLSLMLWLGYRGHFVPMQLTFEWLNQDIIVGITALVAASLFFGRRRFLRREALLWNFFGILSLFNVYVLLYFSYPGETQVFRSLPDSSFVTAIPFVWIVAFLMPVALAFHLFSIQQLWLLKSPRRQFDIRQKRG